jgi:phosphomannomutase
MHLLNLFYAGTAGLRGEMGIGFARMNDVTVIQAAQGLADNLLTEHADLTTTGGVVIGYDHRARGK